MASGVVGVIVFVIGLIVSTIIIYIVTRLFGEKEGIRRAFITAIIGAIIFGIAHFLLGNGLLAATIGGIIWLLALSIKVIVQDRVDKGSCNRSYYMDSISNSRGAITYCSRAYLSKPLYEYWL